MHEDGSSNRKIAAKFNSNHVTIGRLIARYHQKGTTKKASPPGRPSSITDILIQRIILCIKRDRSITIPGIMRENPDLGVSEDTIRRLIHEHTPYRCYRKKSKPYVNETPQSPDMNPIENLWAILDKRVQHRKPRNREELLECLTDAWNNIPVDMLRTLARSMPNRLRAVIVSEGYPTKY